MNADAWVGIAAIVLTAGVTGAGVVWRIARLETRVDEITRRLQQIEHKMDNRAKRRLD